MMKEIRNKIYWSFSYEFRQTMFMAIHPIEYMLLKSLRTKEPERFKPRTFKPFIENRCIFVQIPKVAGVSISNSLFGYHTGGHVTIPEYQLVFNRKEFDSFFKFTFVRNPWDRLLSAFLYLKNGGRNKGDYQWAEKYLLAYNSFNDFVMEWVNERNITKGIHFKPQYRFLTTPNNLKPEVDFIGFFENIVDDYQYIRNVLRFGEELKYENKTKGKTNDYRLYYNDKTIEIVSKVYRDDIELFGYDFENTSLEKQLSNRSGW